jgi:predicted acylesterase/phospholipase RssA
MIELPQGRSFIEEVTVKIKRFSIGVLVVAVLTLISGCALYGNGRRIVYDRPMTGAIVSAPHDDGDYFIALTVSGGGSRAAVWHAAVMKELYEQIKLPDGRSIIDEIDYISSVSGGSLSSADFCMNKPEVDTTHTKEYDDFFKRYLADMRRDIEAKMAGNIFTLSRYLLASEDKAVVLKDTFDKLYFGGRTFRELDDRERRGISPVLIANGTVMDTGARFLFTTLSRADFEVRPEDIYHKLIKTSLAESSITFGGDVLGIMTPDDIGISIDDMEVSRAVAASASVPVILGPVVLRDNKRSTPVRDIYVHVNDGGVNDNQGLVTIMQLLFGRFAHEQKKFKGAMIIIVDANQSIDPRYSEELVRAFSTIGMVERSYYICFYQGRAFAFITIMNILRSDPRFKDVKFVYISPYQADDPTISDLFTKTPTRFKITPENADNLERAASIVVEKMKGRILEGLKIKNAH